MAQIKHIADGTLITVAQQPEWVAGIWECGDQRFTDPAGTLYQPVAPAPTYPVVSPNTVINCFTVAEQVAIEAAIAGSPNASPPVPANASLGVFWSRLNDPRLTEVVLGLPSVQQGITAALTAASAGGALAQGATVASRTAQVLAAQLQ